MEVRTNTKLLLSLTLFVTALISCAKHEKPSWPAHIKDLQGFSDVESTRVSTALSALNDQSDKKFLTDEKSGYPISIKKVSGSDWPSSRAGYATVGEDHCTIEVASKIFTDEMSDYLMSVVWHEVGHCAGLTHDHSSGEIMSPTTNAFEYYSADKIQRFVATVRSAVGF